jgi:hypothetical protein
MKLEEIDDIKKRNDPEKLFSTDPTRRMAALGVRIPARVVFEHHRGERPKESLAEHSRLKAAELMYSEQ